MPSRVRTAAAAVAFAGCSPSPPPAAEVAVIAPVNVAVEAPPPAAPPPPAPPPGFAFPADAAGQMLPRVVAPTPPPAPAAERFGEVPKPRATPARIADPDPTPKTPPALPPLLPPKPAGLKPAAPPDRVPIALGGPEAVPLRPTLPDAPGLATRAPDVNRPPALPPLGRQTPDRAGLDDPTADPANAAIVGRPTGLPWSAAGFLRMTLPDPFEFAEQVKPRPAVEPGLNLIPVDPQRPDKAPQK